jgi:hypothetical protein
VNAAPATNVLVVVPAYNEQDAIAEVIEQIAIAASVFSWSMMVRLTTRGHGQLLLGQKW